MAIVNSILKWIMKKRMHQIELFKKYPNEVQEEWLHDLISAAQATEWGKKYDYESISTPEIFKERVPIQNYDTLKPYIERMLKGEQNILWPSPIKWFAKSSGTTADRSKYIPVSEEALEDCHYTGGKDLLSIYCQNRPDNAIFDGKGLVLGGSHQINEIGKTSSGDLSAIIVQNLPFWAEFHRFPDIELTLNPNFEEKIEKIAHLALNENITSISGVPTWNIVLAKRILEISGKSNLLEVWPNLEFYFHGGVSFKPYQEQFNQLIPSDKMYYMENYNASEGYFALQDLPDSDEMLLMLDYGIYFEFLPMENLLDEHPKTKSLSEVELGKNYAIIISTNAGLWRYMIGDTVRFTCLSPYRIQVSGRTKQYINTFGEELIVDNAEDAIRAASKATSAIVKDYTAGPVYFKDKEAGAHEWIIEFEKRPENTQYFFEVLDQVLRKVNSDYDAKRVSNLALKEPVIHVAKEGTFYNWMKKRGKLGGQNKVPRLSNDRVFLDEVLAMMAENP